MVSRFLQILDTVNQLFLRQGIKSVTMDDISRELGMSKKTLYQYVESKDDLVYKVMQRQIDRDTAELEKIMGKDLNAIEELMEVTRYASESIKQVHPSIHYDLHKYYPLAWEVFNRFKKEYVLNLNIRNLEKGIREGVFRAELKPYIIAQIYTERFDIVFNGEAFPKNTYSFQEVHREMMIYHISGIATEQGLKSLKKFLDTI